MGKRQNGKAKISRHSAAVATGTPIPKWTALARVTAQKWRQGQPHPSHSAWQPAASTSSEECKAKQLQSEILRKWTSSGAPGLDRVTVFCDQHLAEWKELLNSSRATTKLRISTGANGAPADVHLNLLHMQLPLVDRLLWQCDKAHRPHLQREISLVELGHALHVEACRVEAMALATNTPPQLWITVAANDCHVGNIKFGDGIVLAKDVDPSKTIQKYRDRVRIALDQAQSNGRLHWFAFSLAGHAPLITTPGFLAAQA